MGMGLRRTAAVPARSGFRGVFCAVWLAGLGGLGCDDPARIVRDDPGEDLTPPQITFVFPSRDTTFNSVFDVVVYVHVSDPSGIDTLTAVVSGGLDFVFAPIRAPLDTALDVGFELPTYDRTADSIRIDLVATDGRQNKGPPTTLRLVVH